MSVHAPSHYVKVWGLLLVLLAISIVGPMAEIGWLTLITAFGIAFVKAGIVVREFMHLNVEKKIVWYILITCLVFMVLFFGGTSPDVLNHKGNNWVNVAAQAEVQRVEALVKAGKLDSHGDDDPSHAAPAPAKPAPPTLAEMKTDDEKLAWLMKTGERVYLHGGDKAPGAACTSCHRPDGRGMPPGFPPLVAQKSHLDCKVGATTVIKGRSGPLNVGGVEYNAVMVGSPELTNDEVAAVLTYARNSWGNKFGPCMPADVAAAR